MAGLGFFLDFDVTLPVAGLALIDPFVDAPVFTRAAVAGSPLVTPFAQWVFDTDASSLDSISSGHRITATASAAPSYDATSVTIAGAGNAGLSLPIADALVAQTWSGTFKITGTLTDGGVIFGNQADASTDAVTGWMLFRNNFAGGALFMNAVNANGSGAVPVPSFALGDTMFFAIAMDTGGGIEAMIGGGARSMTVGKATGTATFGAAGTAGDTITINGNAIGLVASGATGAQINIGGSAAVTAANLAAYVNANTATLGVLAMLNGAVVTFAANIGGTAGNSIGLAKSSTAITLSGATLSGGVARTIAPRVPALGPAYSIYAPYLKALTVEELDYKPATFTTAQMQALYAEEKTRQALRGVTVK